jgi:hypothetical protein
MVHCHHSKCELYRVIVVCLYNPLRIAFSIRVIPSTTNVRWHRVTLGTIT